MKINGKNLLVTVPREIQILDFCVITRGMKCAKHEEDGAGRKGPRGRPLDRIGFCHRDTEAQRGASFLAQVMGEPRLSSQKVSYEFQTLCKITPTSGQKAGRKFACKALGFEGGQASSSLVKP